MPILRKLYKGGGLPTNGEIVVTPVNWLKDPIVWIALVGFTVLTLNNVLDIAKIWITDPVVLEKTTRTVNIFVGYFGAISAFITRIYNVKEPVTFNS